MGTSTCVGTNNSGSQIIERCVLNRERRMGKQARSIVLILIVAVAGIALGHSSVEDDRVADHSVADSGAAGGSAADNSATHKQADNQEADVTIVLENVQAEAWVVAAVEGAAVEGPEVAETGVEDPVIRMQVGKRYRFVNLGTLRIHPFAIRGMDGAVLLGQRPKDRPFEIDPAVAFVADDEGVTFTLTEALAEVVSAYYCTAHPAPLMESGIEIVGQADR